MNHLEFTIMTTSAVAVSDLEEEKSTITLSFVILNDLHPMFDPFVKEVHGTIEKVADFLQTTRSIVEENLGYAINDHVCGWETPDSILTLARDLLNDKYIVYNRVSKYYVLAFSVNWTRFDVYSKDCDAQLINWRDNDEHDPIAFRVNENENYNQNPVIALLTQLSKD